MIASAACSAFDVLFIPPPPRVCQHRLEILGNPCLLPNESILRKKEGKGKRQKAKGKRKREKGGAKREEEIGAGVLNLPRRQKRWREWRPCPPMCLPPAFRPRLSRRGHRDLHQPIRNGGAESTRFFSFYPCLPYAPWLSPSIVFRLPFFVFHFPWLNGMVETVNGKE
ncbi:MAG: hypothetical protein D6679_13775 [Candidatus Hydrogenedentota bacterium]|nr:MAG: hypothetical protein D6679_13775 [Candidatus Hydrogenedentota bacterium]